MTKQFKTPTKNTLAHRQTTKHIKINGDKEFQFKKIPKSVHAMPTDNASQVQHNQCNNLPSEKSDTFSTIKRRPHKTKEDLCYTPKKNKTITVIAKENARPKKHSTPKRKFGFHKEQAVPNVSPIQQAVPNAHKQHEEEAGSAFGVGSDVYNFHLSPTSHEKVLKKRMKKRKEVRK